MFRFGFKKKWRGNKESKEPEQPAANGIKLLTFRAIDNEFTPRAPVVQFQVPKRPRVKRNALEIFRQSYPNFSHNGENNTQEPVQFETVSTRQKIVSNESNAVTLPLDEEDKSTLIFMTEDHDVVVPRNPIEIESPDEDDGVNLGAAFNQRIHLDETVPSVEQEQELEDLYDTRKLPVQTENAVAERSNSDKESIGDRETVDLDHENSELGEDNFRIHIVQHANDGMSMISFQSGDTLLDTASVLQDDRPNFQFDDYYNFGESQTDGIESTEEIEEVMENITPQINHKTNNSEEMSFEVDDQVKQVEKRVAFDVSDDEQETHKPRRKPEIITTPQRKETLEDVKMKQGYSLQASALFFNDENDSETSA